MHETKTAPCPVVIGGLGGSGTRVYREIAQIAGYDMTAVPPVLGFLPAAWRARQHDFALFRYLFHPLWTDRYLRGTLGPVGHAMMAWSFRCCLRLSGFPRREPWGWKNPRSIYLLPFFADMCPDFGFLHVVRDGRDHAFHERFSYVSHQLGLLRPEERRLAEHVRKALMWSRTNALAEQAARTRLGERYLCSRLEDLCADPAAETGRVMAFLGVTAADRVAAGAACVRTPRSLGRWRAQPPERLADVEAAIGPHLQRYRYALGNSSS